ncbi:MAG: DNA gyrase subunit A, partial [Clostridia bacterium]|nr:DNA gyrase subunit A [Clostridia bacterium]
DMRLARLTALEVQKLEDELDEIKKRIEYLLSLLGDEKLLLGAIREELEDVKKRFDRPRRTGIEHVFEDIDMESMIQEEDMVVTMTHFGYIKRITTDAYHVQNRGGKGITALSTKEEDFVEEIFVTTTHKNIMFFTNTGRVFRKKCYEIPEASRQAKGTAIVNLLQLMPGESITACFPINNDEAKYLVLTTKMGIIKKSAISDYDNIRKGGLIAINLKEGDELIGVNLTSGEDELIVGTKCGYSIRFSEKDIRSMGRVSMGVRAINLRDEDEVIGVAKVIPNGKLLCVSENGFGKVTDLQEYKVQNRGGKGIKTMNIGAKTGKLVAVKLVDDSFDIMLISTDGTMIRIPVDQISQVGRATIGVTLMKLRGDDKIVCVAKVEKAKENDISDETAAEQTAPEE